MRQPTPHLARADAANLAALAAQIARDASTNGCAADREIGALQTRASALIATGRVPAALRRPLLTGVASLAREQPPCAPPAPALQSKHGHKKPKHGKGHKVKGD